VSGVWRSTFGVEVLVEIRLELGRVRHYFSGLDGSESALRECGIIICPWRFEANRARDDQNVVLFKAFFRKAGIAQLVEQLICNQQVIGSNPIAGSFNINDYVGRSFVSGRVLGRF
jgi:hypothetical protein